jgi:1-acyl-sn-glycerol-3-phosphate acyltransferase
MKYISLAWRFIGTSFLWFFFGSIGLLLSVFLFPFLYLFVPEPGARQVAARKIIAATFGAFMWGGGKMGVFTFDVTGLENRDPEAGQLILANHPTLIDVVLLLSVLPQVDCVVKEAVIRNPFMRASVTTANYISNREPSDLLNDCVERLQHGASLLLFPEGTRSTSDRPLRFKLGAAEVAIRSQTQILPVIVDCRPRFLAKHEPWYSIPAIRPHFDVRILPPMPVEQVVGGRLARRHVRRALNDALVSLFSAELS